MNTEAQVAKELAETQAKKKKDITDEIRSKRRSWL
jgi:hypothetical protein